MSIDRASASGIKKFARCPKSFWYKYVERYPVEDEESKYIQLGNAIHDSIEHLLKEYPTLRDEAAIKEVLREKNQEIKEYPSDMEEDAQTCIETASRFIVGEIPQDGIRAIEERWNMDRMGLEFTGYLDVATQDRIIDWKTGSSEDKEFTEKLQAAVYIEMYEEEFGEYPEAVEFVYLKDETLSSHNRIVDGEVMWNSHRNKYFENIEDYVKEIKKAERNNNWPAEPEDSKCYWCDYSDVCSAYIGSGDVEPHMIQFGI